MAEGGSQETRQRRSARVARLARRELAAWLTLIAIIAVVFAVTAFFVGRYRNKRAALGREWYARGLAALQGGRAPAAEAAFRNALAYQPGSFDATFALAQSLTAEHRLAEAQSYFLALWQQAPQSGPVNVNLARLAASQHRTQDVIRYYHNAIFGLWSAQGAEQSRLARHELISYLLDQGQWNQADSELLAEIQALPPTAAAHLEAGRQFLAAGDPTHALGQFREALRRDPDNGDALAGAGEAAYQQGNYGLAHRYLARAAVRLPGDPAVAQRLATVAAVLDADPLAYHLSRAERRSRVLRDLATAQARLAACAARLESTNSQPSPLAPLQARSKALTGPGLRRLWRDPNAIPNTLSFIFAVEEQTARSCGPPAGDDLALLLLAHARELASP